MLLQEIAEINPDKNRQDKLQKVKDSIPHIYNLAKHFFDMNEIKIEPAGFINDPDEYEDNNSSIDIAVYLNDGRILNQRLSKMFSRYINRHLKIPFFLNTIVFEL